jgi:hypothetical protein
MKRSMHVTVCAFILSIPGAALLEAAEPPGTVLGISGTNFTLNIPKGTLNSILKQAGLKD